MGPVSLSGELAGTEAHPLPQLTQLWTLEEHLAAAILAKQLKVPIERWAYPSLIPSESRERERRFKDTCGDSNL